MALPPQAVSITKPLHTRMAACPSCKTVDLVWKTKDAQSPFLGQVYCPACQWTKTKQEFMAIWAASNT